MPGPRIRAFLGHVGALTTATIGAKLSSSMPPADLPGALVPIGVGLATVFAAYLGSRAISSEDAHSGQLRASKNHHLQIALAGAFRNTLSDLRDDQHCDLFDSWDNLLDAALDSPETILPAVITADFDSLLDAANPHEDRAAAFTEVCDLLRGWLAYQKAFEAAGAYPFIVPSTPPDLPSDLLLIFEKDLLSAFDREFSNLLSGDDATHARRAFTRRSLQELVATSRNHSKDHAEQTKDHVEQTSLLKTIEALVRESTLTVPASSVPSRLTGPADPRLRPMRNYFIGRMERREAVLAFLRGQSPLGVVTGMASVQGAPGIGKTELCKAALKLYLQENPACRGFYVQVAEIRTVQGLLAAIGRALGDEKLGDDDLLLLVRLQAEADLLYLDNLEDALPEADPASSAKAFALLRAIATHGVKTLVSSRRSLGSAAEELPLGSFPPAEARELFDHFWFQVGGASHAEPERLNRFLELDLGGHALALRLLALQAPRFGSWQNLRDLWLQRGPALAQDAGFQDRQFSLEFSIHLSWDQTEPSASSASPEANAARAAARDLWFALVCFPAGMSDAAQRSLVAEASALAGAVDLLTRLGVADLVNGRLQMLAPLRQFAASLGPAAEPVWERCLLYFLAVAQIAQSTEFGSGEGRAAALTLLAGEYGNLAEAVLLAARKGLHPEIVERLHAALQNSYQFHAAASLELLERLASFFDHLARRRSQASTLKALGDLERRLGKPDLARTHYDQALALFVSEQDNLGRANTLKALGDLESRLGKPDLARTHYDQALALFVSEQDNLGRANTLKALGDLELQTSALGAAFELFRESAQLYETEQEPSGLAQCLTKIAIILKAASQKDDAAHAASAARAAARASKLPPVIEWVERVLTSAGL
jgi:tetratricopeptide (TPR) repeat protein